MKLIPLLFLLLVTHLSGAEAKVSFEKIVRYHGTQAGNSIEVLIHQREFDFSPYKVTGALNTDVPVRINGLPFSGTDGNPALWPSWPRLDTIAEIQLKWNGKPIPVPKILHINLLSLTLDSRSIQFIPRPSGEELLIQATGGDGGGSSLVSLVLRKNGQHHQYPPGYCEDGLPKYPYSIDNYLGIDSEGRSRVEYIDWLKPLSDPQLPAPPADPASTFTFEKIVRYRETQADNRIEVLIRGREVDFSRDKITGGTTNTDGPAKLNGVAIAGTDARSPVTFRGWPKLDAIADVQLKWNGKPVPVPQHLYNNLINPTLLSGWIQFIPRPGGEELLVQLTGGDGAGSYLSSLILRKNGKHQQSPHLYCKNGLPRHPFNYEQITGTDDQGEPISQSCLWLQPPPATLPPAK